MPKRRKTNDVEPQGDTLVIRYGIIFFALLAFTVNAAELFTYSPSILTEEDWGSTVVRAEPVLVDLEALQPRQSDISSQALTAQSVASLRVDGVSYSATLERVEEHGKGNFTRFVRLEGSSDLSSFTVVDGAVWVELWHSSAPTFHRSIVTRDGQQYLVEWNEKEINRLLTDDVVEMESVPPDADGPEAAREREEVLTSHQRRRSVRSGPTPPPPPPSPCPAGEAEFLESDAVYGYDKTVLSWYDKTSPEKAKAAFEANVQAVVVGYNLYVQNSKGGNYRFRLAGIEEIDYIASGSLLADLNWVLNSPQVAKLPMKYQSYIYFGLWVGINGPNGKDPKYCGLATGGYTGKPGEYPPRHIVQPNCGVGGGIHELGHNTRKFHQKLNGNSPDITYPVQYAYGYALDGYWRDIMCSGVWQECPTGCPAGPFFSNKDVIRDGMPTGTSQTRNFATDAVVFKARAARKVCVKVN